MKADTLKLIKRMLPMLTLIATGVTQAAVMEEVVVTAQKREQSLQDVGVSVTAFTGDQVDQLGFTDSVDVTSQTPGLSYGTPTAEGNNASLTLRGVGLSDFNDNNEGPVAVYVDEVYISALSGVTFQLFDLQRIEVLRGPQGTLYGRNTTGGLVHFVTARPTRDTEGYLDVTLAENNQIKAEGVISGSLGDNAQARLSFAHNEHDGYVDNRVAGVPDPNDTDNDAGRLQLAIQPSDSVNVLLNVHGSKNDANMGAWQHEATYSPDGGVTSLPLPPTLNWYGSCPGCDAFGYRDTDGDPWAGAYDRDGDLVIENSGASANIEWRGEGFTFTSITGFENFERFYEEDTDIQPFKIVHNTYEADIDQLTQEFRLAGESEKMHWVAGFYYYDQETDGGFQIDASGIGFIIGDANYTQETDSWSAFGQIEYDLTDKLIGIAGLRYTDEERELDYLSADKSGLIASIIGDNTMYSFNETIDHDNVTGTLGLNWHPTFNTLVYGSISLGAKSAGFNTGMLDGTGFFGSTVRADVPYDEEILTSYEVGLKTDLFDGSSRLNAAVFYYDYSDYQAFAFVNLNQVIFNTDAQIYGAEIELVTNPIEGLDIQLGAAFLNTTAEDIPLNDASGRTRDRDMILAPEVSLNGLVRYQWAVGTGQMAAQVDFNYQSEAFFDIQNHPISEEDGYDVWNARLSYMGANDKWKVTAFVKNVFEEEYRQYSFDVTQLFGFNQVAYGRPRWAGVSFRYNLN